MHHVFTVETHSVQHATNTGPGPGEGYTLPGTLSTRATSMRGTGHATMYQVCDQTHSLVHLSPLTEGLVPLAFYTVSRLVPQMDQECPGPGPGAYDPRLPPATSDISE
jgi:hypothetical protein